MKTIYTQPHWRTLIVSFYNVLPLLRICLPDAVEQPAGMKIAAVGVSHSLSQVILLALKLTQYTIDQALELRLFQRHCTINGFSQHCMRRDSCVQELVNTHHQQIMQCTLFTC